MRIFNRYVYLLVSPTKISLEKRRALAEGRSHIHGDPVRKAVEKPRQEVEKNG